MWGNLPKDQKNRYKKLITNFARLSEAFAQKSTDEDIYPIINSKYQETAFRESFRATVEDIGNSSFDASVATDSGMKYLVGIKSFIHNGKEQKIAQFKAQSGKWTHTFSQIEENAKKSSSQEEADKKNEPLYLELASTIAKFRNERIQSSIEQLRGFSVDNEDVDNVESVYHVLMPDKKDDPMIYVGETEYTKIDIDNIKILGSTYKGNPGNFRFADGRHTYKYTRADSQLYMDFNNENIHVDKWPVTFIPDSLRFFENFNENVYQVAEKNNQYNVAENKTKLESYSWLIPNKNMEVERKSAINAFNAASKLGRKGREPRIKKFESDYADIIGENRMKKVVEYLNTILLEDLNKTNPNEYDLERSRLKDYVRKHDTTPDKDVYTQVIRMIYHPADEVYIPIPNSKKFHENHPDFFGKNLVEFVPGTNKLLRDDKDRTFNMKLMPSGKVIKAHVVQDNGKGIQSVTHQDILGKWMRKDVFQLEDFEILTIDKLEEIGINGFRLTKNPKENCVELRFIWIDPENPPEDDIGWESMNNL